jgi:site-specific DNA recombinase
MALDDVRDVGGHAPGMRQQVVGIALDDLARNAQRLFAMQEPREKRRLLNFVLSNCTWEDGEVVATFREPFDLLAQTATNQTC